MSRQRRTAEEAQDGRRSHRQPSNRRDTKQCSVSCKPRRQRALHASRATASTLVHKNGQPTHRAPRPSVEKPVGSMRPKLTLKQACFQGYPESAVYVQIPVGSRNSASRNAYHTSLRPSSLFEPRHPSLKVVRKQSPSGGFRRRAPQARHKREREKLGDCRQATGRACHREGDARPCPGREQSPGTARKPHRDESSQLKVHRGYRW